MPHLELLDDEAAALIKELHDTVDNAATPYRSATHTEGDPRQAAAGTTARAPATTKGLRATASQETPEVTKRNRQRTHPS